jgi:hypothetical protein
VSVKRLQNIDDFLEPVSSIDDVEFFEAYKETSEWAIKHHFTLDIFFLLHSLNSGIPIKCASWWSEKYHCYLLFYLAEGDDIRKKMIEFHTDLKPEASLTTCSTVDSLALPRLKNNFIQCRLNVSPSKLFNQHMKSIKSLENKYNLSVSRNKYDLFPKIRQATKEQADYVTELLFWKHRGFYWFFIKKPFLKYRIY